MWSHVKAGNTDLQWVWPPPSVSSWQEEGGRSKSWRSSRTWAGLRSRSNSFKLVVPDETICPHHISTITQTSTGSDSTGSKIILVFRERDEITARALRLTTYNLKLSRGEKRRVEAKLCGLVWMLRSWQPAIIQFQGNVSNASKTESCCSPPLYQNPEMFV